MTFWKILWTVKEHKCTHSSYYILLSALIQKTYILINHTLTQEIYTILVNTVVF